MGVSSKTEVCGNLCQCKVNYDNKSSSKVSSDNLFSPIKNKMKVLKKIKKRMGLGRLKLLILALFFGVIMHCNYMIMRKRSRLGVKTPDISWMDLSWWRVIGNALERKNCKKLDHDSSINVFEDGNEQMFSWKMYASPPDFRCISASVKKSSEKKGQFSSQDSLIAHY